MKDSIRIYVRKVRWNGVNIINLLRIWPSGGLCWCGTATAGFMNCRELYSWELTALPRGSPLHRRVLLTARTRSQKSVCPARVGQLSQRSCWRCRLFAKQHCVVGRVVTDVSNDRVAFTLKVRSTTPGTRHLTVQPSAQPNPQSAPFLHFLHCSRNSDGPTVGTWFTRKCAAAENN